MSDNHSCDWSKIPYFLLKVTLAWLLAQKSLNDQECDSIASSFRHLSVIGRYSSGG